MRPRGRAAAGSVVAGGEAGRVAATTGVAAGAAERVGVVGIWAWGAAAAAVAGAAHCRWRVRLFL